MKIQRLSLFLLVILTAILSGCVRTPSDGFRPPVAADPVAAYTGSWEPVNIISGAYKITFKQSDGRKLGVTGNMVVEPGNRARVDLSSDRGAEAVVTLTSEFINLLNHQERYYIREESSAETSERIVGIALPTQEAAGLLVGFGFDVERFDHVMPRTLPEGDIALTLLHSEDDLKAAAVVDRYGRLTNIQYSDGTTDQILVSAQYSHFRQNTTSGLVWPAKIVLDLPIRGEQITIQAIDVDIDNQRVISRMDRYVFARLERGGRIYIADVPPGAPLLYRNLKAYVEEDK